MGEFQEVEPAGCGPGIFVILAAGVVIWALFFLFFKWTF